MRHPGNLCQFYGSTWAYYLYSSSQYVLQESTIAPTYWGLWCCCRLIWLWTLQWTQRERKAIIPKNVHKRLGSSDRIVMVRQQRFGVAEWDLNSGSWKRKKKKIFIFEVKHSSVSGNPGYMGDQQIGTACQNREVNFQSRTKISGIRVILSITPTEYGLMPP